APPLAGVHHRASRSAWKGAGDVVLSAPREAADRGELGFAAGLSYLVLRDGPEGAVVAEVTGDSQAHTLSLPPGRSFRRGRRRDHLREGTVTLAGGRSLVVHDEALEWI